MAQEEVVGGASPAVLIVPSGQNREVFVGDTLFTVYRPDEAGHMPVCYPVLGPDGHALTRQYPQEDAAPGEAQDHVHHRSLWFAHGAVNGIDFWSPQHGSGARIVHIGYLPVPRADAGQAIRAANAWLDRDGQLVCRDERFLRFGVSEDGSQRILDYTVTLIADPVDLVLGDTKEGTMAIRTAAPLRVAGPVAQGSVRNSEGVEGKAVWGKRARFVVYWGPLGDQDVSIGIFDHPDNPRHPTHWHARDYGLCGANPFGVHDFERKPAGTGDLRVPRGDRLTLRYRFVFGRGGIDALDAEACFQEFAATAAPSTLENDR
ncbi:MAG: hypothetical protein RL562_2692 [Planctomycetota bacterium]